MQLEPASSNPQFKALLFHFALYFVKPNLLKLSVPIGRINAINNNGGPGFTMNIQPLTRLTVLTCIAFLCSSAHAAAPTEIAPHYGEMSRDINQRGSVRVIVETAQQPASTFNRTAVMRSERQKVLDRLRPHGILPIAESTYGYRSVFAVNQAQLDTLVATSGVRKIYIDRLLKPSLASATVLINTAVPHSAGLAGAGATVAILDSGIDGDHEVFGNRIVAEACFSTKYSAYGATHLCSLLSPNGANGQRTDTGPGSAEACYGVSGCDHGTHVASIAAGQSATITGVAPQANIIAIQVFTKFTDYEPACGTATGSCISAFTSDVADALDYVATLAGSYNIAAVNLSLGDGTEHTTPCTGHAYANGIHTLYTLGIVTAVASGNESFQNGVAAPACVPEALSVGAVNDSDWVPSWSNSDDTLLDMLAPGANITAAVSGGGYGTKSGTSMATPMVTGALALLKSKNSALTAAQMSNILADYTWTTSTQVLNNRAGNDPQPRLDLGKVFLPRLQINQPANGASFADTDVISFSGSADDTQDGNLTSAITWESSIDGAFIPPTSLSPGNHTITATVVDSDNMVTTATIDITVIASNPDSDGDGLDDAWEISYFGDLSQNGSGDFDNDGFSNAVEFNNGTLPNDKAPTAGIIAPVNGNSYPNGSTLTFTGFAIDNEDGNISTSISWTSNLDGNLGTGATLNNVALSQGNHTITATVTDSAGGSPLNVPTIQVYMLPRDGDVNNDGLITIADLVLLERHLIGSAPLGGDASVRADLFPPSGTGDGILDQSDLLIMEKALLDQ